ncbi:hypothetical protein Tco_0234341 [Tanacetum coccineum]
MKRWEELIRENWATSKSNLPYGMILTRLFHQIMDSFPHLDNGIYDIVDRVRCPLAVVQAHKPCKDCRIEKGRHSTLETDIREKDEKSSKNGQN